MSDSESLANKAVKGTIWSAVDRFGVMALTFIINLVLARLLSPADFGAIGMLMIFIMVSQTIVEGGFAAALIQKKKPTELDYSTIFLWSVALGTALYVILYLSAPLVAHFYRMPVLCDVLRAIGVILIFCGMASVQTAKLQKSLQFKEIAIVDVGTYIVAGISAILLALNGFGIWSLVAMMICQTICKVLILYILTRWRPLMKFSIQSFKSLFSFGGYLFIGNILENIGTNVQGIIIGRLFSAAQMGYYTQASKLENITGYSIPQVIATVMYPVFSQYQENKPKLCALITKDIRIISFLIYPLLSILFIFAPEIIQFLFGDKWMPCVPYYRILLVGALFYCINNINYYAVAAVGKSRALFFASFYKWGMLGLFMFVGLKFGMTGLVCSMALNMANVFFCNAILAQHYIGQNVASSLRAVMPPAVLCLICSLAIIVAKSVVSIIWPLGILLFILIYAGLAIILKVRAYSESKSILTNLISKNR